jgi:beta-lactamase regulating signal transducer with metallopeptidase domain
MASSLFILSTTTNKAAAGSFVEIPFTQTLAAFAATYWLHSTLLLLAAWLLLRSTKPDSHFIRERVWKLAATAGLFTATVQLVLGLGFSLSFASETDVATTQRVSQEFTSESESSSLAGVEAEQHLTTALRIVQDSLNHLGQGLPATLTESKLPKDKVAATSSPAITEQKQTPNPSVTYLPLDNNVSTAAPVVMLKQSQQARVAVEFVNPTDDAKARTVAAANNWVQMFVSWLAVSWFFFSAVYLAWQSVRFRWQMRDVSEAAPSHRKLLDSICESRGFKRRVELLKSDRFVEPVAYGLFRQTILIPAQVEKRLNLDELAALLSHELAHLTRGDILWLVIGRVLTTCFAFQPLNFLARKHWQEHAEFQCDDWAVEGNVDRLTLARSLTLVAEWRARRKSCVGVVSAGGARFHISDRVERLVGDAVPDLWRRRSRRFLVHIAALLAAGAVIVFGPQTSSAERESEKAKQDTASNKTDTETQSVGTVSDDDTTATVSTEEISASTEEISALIREVEGLSGDVSQLLAELRTIEPLLAELERRPELADQVSQLRIRIGQLRRAAEMRTRQTAGVSRPTGT